MQGSDLFKVGDIVRLKQYEKLAIGKIIYSAGIGDEWALIEMIHPYTFQLYKLKKNLKHVSIIEVMLCELAKI